MTLTAATIVSGGSPTTRRTRADIESLKAAIYDMVNAAKPMTVRQVFYRGVGFGHWTKTEADYKNVVCRLLAQMRREHELPFHWIADGTRWQRRPSTYSSVEDALTETARLYRRRLWDHAPRMVEVWLEKEALAGVLVGVTAEHDVPLMVTRGYPSLSYLYSAAEEIKARHLHRNQATTVLYFGDHDPSGDDIARRVELDLTEFSGVEVEFVRCAVTAEQIEDYDLPTRPTKRKDSRAKAWTGTGSVEVDAIDPTELRTLLDLFIADYLDPHQLAILRAVEAEERSTLFALAGTVDR